jgi:hypothetical protein
MESDNATVVPYREIIESIGESVEPVSPKKGEQHSKSQRLTAKDFPPE